MAPRVLHALLKLRSDVFVVEQACVYPDPDDRDVEPTTRHVWLATPGGTPASYLRRMVEPGGEVRLGRIATAPAWRGKGLSRALVASVLDEVDGADGVAILDAQSHLHDFYASMGFEVSGPEFVEDGIPHLPMRRRGRSHWPA
jgi:ElaA protein